MTDDDLSRDAVLLQRAAGLSQSACALVLRLSRGADRILERHAAIGELRQQLARFASGDWCLGADDIAPGQPLLSGTWRGLPVVFKLLFQELDFRRWREAMTAAASAAGQAIEYPNTPTMDLASIAERVLTTAPLLLPFDIAYVETHDTRNGGRRVLWPVVAYPRLHGPTLDRVRRFGCAASEAELRILLGTVGRALTIIAGASAYGHGDVKPQNIMIDERRGLTLLDWNVVEPVQVWWQPDRDEEYVFRATSFYREPPVEVDATPGYAAPEGRRGTAADVFALGVTAYLYATGVHPHNPQLEWKYAAPNLGTMSMFYDAGQRAIDFIRDRRRDNPAALLQNRRPDLPADLVALIEGCVASDSKRRPSLEVLAALSEPVQGQRAAEVFGVGNVASSSPPPPPPQPATKQPAEYAWDALGESIWVERAGGAAAGMRGY